MKEQQRKRSVNDWWRFRVSDVGRASPLLTGNPAYGFLPVTARGPLLAGLSYKQDRPIQLERNLAG
jgi:hypothetical protein